MKITPERIEEVKMIAKTCDIWKFSEAEQTEILNDLHTALEEAQEQLFLANGLASNYEYAKRECIKWNDEAVRLRGELSEAQQTIALKQSSIDILAGQVTDETALHAKTAAKLIIAEQTIARQQLAMSRSLTNLTDALNFPLPNLTMIPGALNG